VAAVISAWAYLELDLGSSLSKLLESHGESGVAIIQAVVGNTSTQRKIVESVANLRLSGEERRLFMALLSIFGHLAKRRNEIVHGLWGLSPQLPDDLLLIRPIDLLRMNAAATRVVAEGGAVALGDLFADRSHISVYTAQELDLLRDEIQRLHDDFFDFWFFLRRPADDIREKHFRKLFEAPHIREILERKGTAN